MQLKTSEQFKLPPKQLAVSSGWGVTHFEQTAPTTAGRASLTNENKIINVNILQKLNSTKGDNNRGPKVSVGAPNGAGQKGEARGGFSGAAGSRTARNMSARNEPFSKKGSQANSKRNRNGERNKNTLQFKSLRDSIGVKSSADSKINCLGNTMSVQSKNRIYLARIGAAGDAHAPATAQGSRLQKFRNMLVTGGGTMSHASLFPNAEKADKVALDDSSIDQTRDALMSPSRNLNGVGLASSKNCSPLGLKELARGVG